MAASKIGFVIETNASGAVRGIKLTDDQLKALNQTQKRGTSVSRDYAKQAAGIVTQMTKYAAVTGGIALTATAALVNQQRQQIDGLAKTADKLGLTTEALSSMRYAAELTGVEQGKLDVALQRMTRRLADVAATGKGPAADALETLNLKIEDLKNLSPDEQVSMIADAMGGLDSQSQRVAVAFKLFDSEGVGLVNTLALGSDGLAKMAAEADQLGITLSRVDAAKVEQANDQLARVGGLVDGIGRQITVQVAPIIVGLANEFLNVAKESGGMAAVIGKAMDFAVDAVGVFADGIHGIGVLFKGGETAILGWSRFMINSIARVVTYIAEKFNSLPSWAKEMLGIEQNIDIRDTLLGKMQAAIEGEFTESFRELQDLLGEELPSRNIKEWTEDVVSQSEEAAREVAANSSGIVKDTADMNTSLANGTAKAINTIALGTQDNWAQTLNRAVTDFDSFKRQMQRGAEDLISQIAVTFASQQLGLNAISFAGGGAGIGGLPAGVQVPGLSGNLLGSFLGAGGGGIASGLSSLLGSGGGGLSATIHSLLAGGQNASQLAQLTPGGLTVDLGTSAGNTGFFQGPLGNAIANVGAGVAGGFVGTNVGSAITGKDANSAIGSTVGSIIGSFGGPVGTFIGSTIGGFLDSLFGSGGYDRWFQIQPGVQPVGREGFDGANIGNISQSAFGAVTFNTEGKLFEGASQDQAQRVIDTLDGLAQIEDVIAEMISPSQASAVRQAVSSQRMFDQEGSTDFSPFFMERFNRIFDAIGGEVDQAFDDLVRSMSPQEFLGSVETVVGSVFQLRDLTDQLDLDIFDQIAEAIDRENSLRSEQGRVYDATLDQLGKVISEYDRSSDSIASLANALTAQQSAAAQLAAAYHNAGNAAQNIFSNTIDAIREDVLSPQQLYSNRRAAISDQIASLSGMTDPGEINAAVSQINSLARSAFGLLNDDQKAASADAFVQFLEDANRSAQQRLTTGLAELQAQQEAVENVVQVEITNAEDIQKAAEQFGIGSEHFRHYVESMGLDVDDFGRQVAMISGSTNDMSRTASLLVLAHEDIYNAALRFGVNSNQFRNAVSALGLDIDQLDQSAINQLNASLNFLNAGNSQNYASQQFIQSMRTLGINIDEFDLASGRYLNGTSDFRNASNFLLNGVLNGNLTLQQAAELFRTSVDRFSATRLDVNVGFNTPLTTDGPAPNLSRNFSADLGTYRTFEVNF